MQYRVLRNLSRGPTTPVGSGPRKGTVIDASELPQRAIKSLMRAKAIAPVEYPPLAALAGWIRRAEICEESLDVHTVDEFLEVDNETIAEVFSFQPQTIARWKKELRDAVNISSGKDAANSGCRGCS